MALSLSDKGYSYKNRSYNDIESEYYSYDANDNSFVYPNNMLKISD
jgi:hypothetical protein